MGIFDYERYIIEKDLMRDIYDIKDSNGNLLVKIRLGVLYLAKIWYMYDASGVEVGRMENKTFAIQPNIRILDSNGVAIATLKGNQTTFHGSEYWFENAEGVEILRARGEDQGHSGQNFYNKNFQILDLAGSVVVEITQLHGGTISVAFLSPNINRQMVLAAIACIYDSENHHS